MVVVLGLRIKEEQEDGESHGAADTDGVAGPARHDDGQAHEEHDAEPHEQRRLQRVVEAASRPHDVAEVGEDRAPEPAVDAD